MIVLCDGRRHSNSSCGRVEDMIWVIGYLCKFPLLSLLNNEVICNRIIKKKYLLKFFFSRIFKTDKKNESNFIINNSFSVQFLTSLDLNISDVFALFPAPQYGQSAP